MRGLLNLGEADLRGSCVSISDLGDQRLERRQSRGCGGFCHKRFDGAGSARNRAGVSDVMQSRYTNAEIGGRRFQ